MTNSKKSRRGISPSLLNEGDLVHLAWAKHLAYDNLARLCDTDWRANNLNPEQQESVMRWLRLTDQIEVH